MRRALIGIAACVVAVTAVASFAAESAFPYKAYIVADEVYVRSGPGQTYYPTDKMKKGEPVEIYRHDPGGWCAIRPPVGSFAWVSGKYLKQQGKRLAIVTEENVSARVGSRVCDSRDVIQVRLRKGEIVEIQESQEIGGGDKPQVWYKIAPPAGEFRWISAKYVSTTDPDESLRKNSGRRDSDGPALTGPEGKPRGRQTLSSEQFRAELNRVDVELSLIVANDPATWRLDDARVLTETLLEQAGTPAERGEVKLLQNKIARFEDIKQRSDQLADLKKDSLRSKRLVANLQNAARQAREKVDSEELVAAGGEFDGVGELRTVVPAKMGDPRYALADSAGKIRFYVTPAPGVNLQNYVGQKIGVKGVRGYLAEQKAEYLTARQVKSLEDGPILR